MTFWSFQWLELAFLVKVFYITFSVSLLAWTLKRVKLTNQMITMGIRDQLSRYTNMKLNFTSF